MKRFLFENDRILISMCHTQMPLHHNLLHISSYLLFLSIRNKVEHSNMKDTDLMKPM